MGSKEEKKSHSSMAAHAAFTRQWLRVEKYDLLESFVRKGGVVVPARSRFMEEVGKGEDADEGCYDQDIIVIGKLELKS